mmetsp:Transcript_14372/g.36726  ORF Transcript_14372/g.36726 Transcript_14372/m.36726 type:complete len:267 (-) Transcript_14372:390-1190(-)
MARVVPVQRLIEPLAVALVAQAVDAFQEVGLSDAHVAMRVQGPPELHEASILLRAPPEKLLLPWHSAQLQLRGRHRRTPRAAPGAPPVSEQEAHGAALVCAGAVALGVRWAFDVWLRLRFAFLAALLCRFSCRRLASRAVLVAGGGGVQGHGRVRAEERAGEVSLPLLLQRLLEGVAFEALAQLIQLHMRGSLRRVVEIQRAVAGHDVRCVAGGLRQVVEVAALKPWHVAVVLAAADVVPRGPLHASLPPRGDAGRKRLRRVGREA